MTLNGTPWVQMTSWWKGMVTRVKVVTKAAKTKAKTVTTLGRQRQPTMTVRMTVRATVAYGAHRRAKSIGASGIGMPGEGGWPNLGGDAVGANWRISGDSEGGVVHDRVARPRPRGLGLGVHECAGAPSRERGDVQVRGVGESQDAMACVRGEQVDEVASHGLVRGTFVGDERGGKGASEEAVEVEGLRVGEAEAPVVGEVG